MAFVFISHASEDKRERVRPLVEALALLGVELWVDRPGHGSSHLGLNDEFIRRHNIRSLRTGNAWDEQISAAVAESGAVLACFSRSLCADRLVLQQEVLLALQSRKLVACIVDGTPPTDLPREIGLINVAKIQAEQVDAGALRQAVDDLNQLSKGDPSGWPKARLQQWEEGLLPPLRQAWQVVRKLVNDIHRVFGTRPITDAWSLETSFGRFLNERRTYFFGRDWLYAGINTWSRTAPNERMLLVTGSPGAGKSAVVAHFVNETPCGAVLAYHCFRHDDSRTLGIDGFTRNLAFMLSRRVPSFGEVLGRPAQLRAMHDLEQSPDVGPDRFFRHAIIDVLENLDRPTELNGGPAWIAIDGLDEVARADDKVSKARLVDLFDYGLRHLPPWLRVMATSRNEDIASQLCGVVDDGQQLVHQMALDTAEPKDESSAYRAYIDARLAAGRTEMNEAGKSQLAERAERNFLYLELVLDGLLKGGVPLEEIEHLPPGLPRIYDLNLRRLYGDADSAEFRNMAQPLLETLAVARRPLSAEALIAVTQLSETELRRQLRKLAPYLIFQEGKYRIFHKSLTDWLLESDGTSPYQIDGRSGHARLGDYCWRCFRKGRKEVGSAISDLAHDTEWSYAMHDGIGHMLAAGAIGRAVELAQFQIEKWNDEEDGSSVFRELAPRHAIRMVLRAFDECTDEQKAGVDPERLARLLTDFYQIEPLEAPLAFLLDNHPARWVAMEERFLSAENYVLRYAMSYVLARSCTEPNAPVNIDAVHGYLGRPEINYRELAAYTLRHLYSRDPRLVRLGELERMGDSETYPARSALGDLLLNLTFQRRFDPSRVKSRRFWEPIWDHNRLDVWDIKAAQCFLKGQALPDDADAGTKAAHAGLMRIEAARQDLLAAAEVRAVPAILNLISQFHQLGSKLGLIGDAEEALAECDIVEVIMRLLFAHPLWDVAETAASILTSLAEVNRAQQQIVVALFDDANWRVRFGAIEAAFQLAEIDRMTLFGVAVRRFFADENSRVRALCAENLISYMLERSPALRQSFLAEFREPVARWLCDDDCWVLEHVFRLLRRLHADGADHGDFFASGMPPLLESLPQTGWHELSRETFLNHIEQRRKQLVGYRT